MGSWVRRNAFYLLLVAYTVTIGHLCAIIYCYCHFWFYSLRNMEADLHEDYMIEFPVYSGIYLMQGQAICMFRMIRESCAVYAHMLIQLVCLGLLIFQAHFNPELEFFRCEDTGINTVFFYEMVLVGHFIVTIFILCQNFYRPHSMRVIGYGLHSLCGLFVYLVASYDVLLRIGTICEGIKWHDENNQEENTDSSADDITRDLYQETSRAPSYILLLHSTYLASVLAIILCPHFKVPDPAERVGVRRRSSVLHFRYK